MPKPRKLESENKALGKAYGMWKTYRGEDG